MYQRIIARRQKNRSIQCRTCRVTIVANDIEKFQPRVAIYNLQVVMGGYLPARAVVPGVDAL